MKINNNIIDWLFGALCVVVFLSFWAVVLGVLEVGTGVLSLLFGPSAEVLATYLGLSCAIFAVAFVGAAFLCRICVDLNED